MIDEKKLINFYSNLSDLENWTDHNTIVLENLNFFWKNSKLRELKKLWDKNFSMEYMAHYFKRDPDEIFLALFHMARENRISKRKLSIIDGIK